MDRTVNKLLLFACFACLCTAGFLVLYYMGYDVYGGNWMDYKPSKQCAGKNISEMNYGYTVGVSMRPAIWSGNKVYTTPYDKGLSLVEGDIVHVVHQGEHFVHRVVGVYPGYFFLKGDNSLDRDPVSYPYSSVVSVVCAVSYN